MTSASPPTLTTDQRGKLTELASLAQGFNTKINLYSEASARDFWSRHVMHSLTLAAKPFPPGARVVDWGTGGGMPGLPLAILFPDVEFVLVDAVQKKIRAVQTMARRLGIDNVTPWHGRAENWQGTATHSVSRATAPLSTLWTWHARIAANPTDQAHGDGWRSGLVCLKGGDLSDEMAELHRRHPEVETVVTPLRETDHGETFAEKVLVEVYRR